MADPQDPHERTGADVRRVLITTITVGAVVAIVWLNRSDLEAIEELTIGSGLTLVALQVAYLFPQSYRYEIITEEHAGIELPSLGWFRIFAVGTLLNNFLMQAGLVYRAAALKRLAGVSLGAYVGSYASFAWLSLLLNLGVAAVLLGALSPSVSFGVVPAWLAMVLAAGVVAVAPATLERVARRTSRQNRIIAAGRDVLRDIVELPRRPRFARRFLVSSAAATALGTAVVVTAAHGLNADVSVGEAALFLALVQMSSLVVITPGNLGIRELAFSLIGGALETGAVNGLLISAVTRATGIFALLIGAGGAWVIERFAVLRSSGSPAPAGEDQDLSG